MSHLSSFALPPPAPRAAPAAGGALPSGTAPHPAPHPAPPTDTTSRALAATTTALGLRGLTQFCRSDDPPRVPQSGAVAATTGANSALTVPGAAQVASTAAPPTLTAEKVAVAERNKQAARLKLTAADAGSHAPAADATAVSAAPAAHIPLPASELKDDTFSLPPAITDNALDAFHALLRVREFYSSADQSFLDSRRALRDAKKKFDSWQSKINENGHGTSLPTSLKVDLVRRVKLTDVRDQPGFYAAEHDALRSLELETARQTATIVTAAMTKHLDYLKLHAAAYHHVALRVVEFTAYADKFATGWAAANSASAPAPVDATPAFPKAAAIVLFHAHVSKRITMHAAAQIAKDMQAAEQQEQARAAESAASERVHAGVHTGDNIAAIATRAAQAQLAPLQSQLLGVVAQVTAALPSLFMPASATSPHRIHTPAPAASQQPNRSTNGPSASIQSRRADQKNDSSKATPFQFQFGHGVATQPAVVSVSTDSGLDQRQPRSKRKSATPANDHNGKRTRTVTLSDTADVAMIIDDDEAAAQPTNSSGGPPAPRSQSLTRQ